MAGDRAFHIRQLQDAVARFGIQIAAEVHHVNAPVG
jgi:hypothetical protein